ncbi:uncharacterized protein LOC122259619 [Penaeus japonicus]|uniref:uncharacterized protein LOC122259619 n=1 Tax=Penaeus japonicus TaxID=27405 RepID=UPI001C70ED9B|nr:uncharacterized protein LOC122259619 [Penaeus japonicus]
MLSASYVLVLVILSFACLFVASLVIRTILRLWKYTRPTSHPRDGESPPLHDERTSLLASCSPTVTLASEIDPRHPYLSEDASRPGSSASSTNYQTFTSSQEQTVVDALGCVQGIPVPISPLPPSPKSERDDVSSKWSPLDSDTEVEFYSPPGSYKERSSSSVEKSMCSTMEMSLKSALGS